MAGAVRGVVVVGGGVGGWMAAAMLAVRLVPAGVRVSVVPVGGEDGSIGVVGPAIALPPAFGASLGAAAPDERELLCAGSGNLVLGEGFTGWTADGTTRMLPYGTVGAPIGSVAFHHLLHRMREGGRDARLADFALSARAAQAERFAPPADDPTSPLSAMGYGVTVAADTLADTFRATALAAGACEATGGYAGYTVADDGLLDAVVTQDGARVAGDLFVDCSGGRRLLFAGDAATDWSRWFPHARAVTGRTRDPHPPLPFVHAGAVAEGWRLTVPLDGARGDVLHHDDTLDEEGAARLLAADEVSFHRLRPGRLTRIAVGNRIAVGAAAAAFPAVLAVAPVLAEADVAALLALFPISRDDPTAMAELDRLAGERADRMRDMALVPGHLNARTEPAWRAARDAPLPDTLAAKLELYRSRGRVPLLDGEPAGQGEWAALFDALDVRARRRDALADVPADEAVLRHFGRLNEVLARTVRAMPSHADALAAHKA